MVNRKRKKEQITEQRREQILNAARDIFTRQGYSNATTAEIARTAGIAEGTIYNYFSSKRELLTALLKSHILSRPLEEMLKQRPGLDFTTMPAIITDRLNMFFDNEDLLFLFLTELVRDAELHEKFVAGVTEPGITMLRDWLQTLIERGTIRPLNTELAARLLPSIMIGLTVMRLIEGKDSPLNRLERREVVAEIVNFLTGALFVPRNP